MNNPNNPSKHGLDLKTINLLNDIFTSYSSIEKVILYGSRAKGDFRPGSDIDITLVAPALTITDLLKIESEIEELPIPYRVDISLFHLIENRGLLAHINRVGTSLG